ncbi:unnamed protein product [Rangifer tarandus platyrhynchus]|uniref:Uncharacterized protein n=1 Tax=Rangifer tarandus platyrhynchus TaxID=3082113 RepID=A0ABN8Y739_RANTA|nr:unnamed protein product [Rangifer tarandus platyrhynchus]
MRTAGRPTAGRPLADPPAPRRSLACSQERLPAGSWTGWSEARGARREEAQTMGPCSWSSGPGPEPRATRRLPAHPRRPQGPGPSREPRSPHAAPGNRSQPGQPQGARSDCCTCMQRLRASRAREVALSHAPAHCDRGLRRPQAVSGAGRPVGGGTAGGRGQPSRRRDVLLAQLQAPVHQAAQPGALQVKGQGPKQAVGRLRKAAFLQSRPGSRAPSRPKSCRRDPHRPLPWAPPGGRDRSVLPPGPSPAFSPGRPSPSLAWRRRRRRCRARSGRCSWSVDWISRSPRTRRS